MSDSPKQEHDYRNAAFILAEKCIVTERAIAMTIPVEEVLQFAPVARQKLAPVIAEQTKVLLNAALNSKGHEFVNEYKRFRLAAESLAEQYVLLTICLGCVCSDCPLQENYEKADEQVDVDKLRTAVHERIKMQYPDFDSSKPDVDV